MKASVTQGSIQNSDADTIVVNLFEGVTTPAGATGAIDKALNGALTELINNKDFQGKVGEIAVLYPRGAIPAKRVLVVGLGKLDRLDLNGVRKAAATAIKRARRLNAHHVATIVHGAGIGGLPVLEAAKATVLASLLAHYRYEADRQTEDNEHVIESLVIVEYDATKIDEIEQGLLMAQGMAAGVCLARDLVNMPPNVATPRRMAKVAEAIAQEHDMKITVGGRKWAEKRSMGAFLAVAKGAGEPPKFIVLEHNSARTDLDALVVVGKGITFDTGGISIKPSERMGLMKSDMGGAAAVMGTMKAIGMLGLPRRVIGIMPCTENMPDANAYRPADVIKASNGKTIEIISTDAEGRMILADGLVYAKKYEPKAVIDLATLTGACVVALGAGIAAGLFSNDDGLRDQVLAASEAAGERVWPLPLWEDYRKAIKSNVADVKNSGGRMGGVATSAVFLKEFVDYPWVHLDIAGMAFSDKAKDLGPAGATGFGVNLLLEFIHNW